MDNINKKIISKKSTSLITDKLSEIKGLSKKKAESITDSIVYLSILILRGMNKNPDFINSGSIPVSWFQAKHKISRSLCAEILDLCFNRSESYRTGVCKSSKLQPWLKEVILEYIGETILLGDVYQAYSNKEFDSKDIFTIEFNIPIENLKEASLFAKRMIYEDEIYQWGKDKGKLKNNQNEYLMAHLYLEAAIKRQGYFAENYRYTDCGRPYQINYGFQNMKRNIRNLVFKDYYMIDINSSFFRMAYEIYSDEWSEPLKNEIYNILNNKDEYYKDFIHDDSKYQEFKIALISCLLGTIDPSLFNLNTQTKKLYSLLNEWIKPQKRRNIANHLFRKEQLYVKSCINDMKEIPHVLIHDGFIVKNKYTLNERFWSIKKI